MGTSTAKTPSLPRIRSEASRDTDGTTHYENIDRRGKHLPFVVIRRVDDLEGGHRVKPSELLHEGKGCRNHR